MRSKQNKGRASGKKVHNEYLCLNIKNQQQYILKKGCLRPINKEVNESHLN